MKLQLYRFASAFSRTEVVQCNSIFHLDYVRKISRPISIKRYVNQKDLFKILQKITLMKSKVGKFCMFRQRYNLETAQN